MKPSELASTTEKNTVFVYEHNSFAALKSLRCFKVIRIIFVDHGNEIKLTQTFISFLHLTRSNEITSENYNSHIKSDKDVSEVRWLKIIANSLTKIRAIVVVIFMTQLVDFILSYLSRTFS